MMVSAPQEKSERILELWEEGSVHELGCFPEKRRAGLTLHEILDQCISLGLKPRACPGMLVLWHHVDALSARCSIQMIYRLQAEMGPPWPGMIARDLSRLSMWGGTQVD